jgi:ABC-type transport system, involved in lipoprotein release, permease component
VTVAGVVEDIRQTSPTDKVFPEIFVEYRQFLSLLDRWAQPQRQNELVIGFLSFAIRTGGDPARAVPVVRDLVKAVDPNIGIEAIVPMTTLAANTVARQRFYAVMLAAFAGIAGVLAVIGIYGLLAYAVVQRTQEIGVRLSLGAPRAQVLALVLRQGLALTTAGITLGMIGATAVTGLLREMLFGITPLDTRTFLAVSIVFATVATIASWFPARRATQIDPIVALRNE